VKLETFDWITYLAKMFQGLRPGHERLPAQLGHDQQLLDRHRRPLHAPARQGRQRGLVREPKVDGLLDTARAELDDRSAPPSTKQIDRIIMEEDASFFPICNEPEPRGAEPEGEGLHQPATRNGSSSGRRRWRPSRPGRWDAPGGLGRRVRSPILASGLLGSVFLALLLRHEGDHHG